MISFIFSITKVRFISIAHLFSPLLKLSLIIVKEIP